MIIYNYIYKLYILYIILYIYIHLIHIYIYIHIYIHMLCSPSSLVTAVPSCFFGGEKRSQGTNDDHGKAGALGVLVSNMFLQ